MSYNRFPEKTSAATNVSVSFHRGSYQKFHDRIQKQLDKGITGGQAGIVALQGRLFPWATDSRLLFYAWEFMAKHGGLAPGPNGRRYHDLNEQDVWRLLKPISTALRNNTYRPLPARRVWIPKNWLLPEAGQRPLLLANIEDRVIQRAIVEVVQPLRDPCFGELVFGGRPRHGREQALARLEQLAVENQHWVWVANDIRDAYEQVPRNPLQDVLRKSLPDQLVTLIMTMSDTGQKRGIPQGGPLSPWLLNEYLHHFLERKWKTAPPGIPLLRYVDDLLAVCPSKPEARIVSQVMQQILQDAGLPLKDAHPIRDLRKNSESVEWLGYVLRRDKRRLVVEIGKKSWGRLAGKLAMSHAADNAPRRARQCLEGWFDQLGPAYEFANRHETVQRAVKFANAEGFEELPDIETLQERWKLAHTRWQTLRAGVNTPKPSGPAVSLPLEPAADVAAPF